MLSVERVKTLLANRRLSDREIEQIRDAFRTLAEITFEKWLAERTLSLERQERTGTCAVEREAR